MNEDEQATRAAKRVHWLPAPAAFNLNAACVLICKAFPDNVGCYLVGSCLERRDHRDVDVRLMLLDEAFERMFPGAAQHPEHHPLWALTCASIACWLQKQTGLAIDFQIQQMTEANKQFGRDDGHGRYPLGSFLVCLNPPDYARDRQLEK